MSHVCRTSTLRRARCRHSAMFGCAAGIRVSFIIFTHSSYNRLDTEVTRRPPSRTPSPSSAPYKYPFHTAAEALALRTVRIDSALARADAYDQRRRCARGCASSASPRARPTAPTSQSSSESASTSARCRVVSRGAFVRRSSAWPAPVPAQMWPGRAQSRRRCGRGERSPGADVGAAQATPRGQPPEAHRRRRRLRMRRRRARARRT